MVALKNEKVYLRNGAELLSDKEAASLSAEDRAAAHRGTMAYSILTAHNVSGRDDKLNIKFDSMASHDITYVGIIQTARATGVLDKFPMPYVLTNCHNSLCAVGGTINEDDHLFGLSAAKKYGGIYVPAHQAVIHSFMREMQSGCGKMILGSDSHTRYGALGTMAVGEGGPELAKQLVGKTYDISYPDIVCVRLIGKPRYGVGPQDVAIALIAATFKSGFVKNSVLEFVGDGVAALPIDFRCGVDVMTTETTCLSSIWVTDDKTKEYFDIHGRSEAYKPLSPAALAEYDRLVEIDLSKIEPMIALPFHPSNAYTIRELKENAGDILREVEKAGETQLGLPEGRFNLTNKITKNGILVDQGVIAGCAGGIFDNITAAADILRGGSIGTGAFALSVYPASQPVMTALTENGCITDLMRAGATIRSAFCGPCFGAGDVPANNCLSVRHTTRNFPNREGSKPNMGQIASVALMDARSIAATAAKGGILTAADELAVEFKSYPYSFDCGAYNSRVYNGFGKADSSVELSFGPNIVDWPKMETPKSGLLIEMVSVIDDPVTTTDELIPSGETSSYRSNPLKLAEFTLSRKDPQYVGRAKAASVEKISAENISAIASVGGDMKNISFGSSIFANKPGDGSAREQAASCQRVLGGFANIACEYATKRYRSNLINWGMFPFIWQGEGIPFEIGDLVYVPNVRYVIENDIPKFDAYIIRGGKAEKIALACGSLTPDEKKILLSGCLINSMAE